MTEYRKVTGEIVSERGRNASPSVFFSFVFFSYLCCGAKKIW